MSGQLYYSTDVWEIQGGAAMNVDFPITVKQFCEMQDQLAGRRTSYDWLDVFEVAVSTINGYY